MRFGFCGSSYTSRSTAVADEEMINLFLETLESQGTIAPKKAYGGATAGPMQILYYTPGLSVFATIPSPTRGSVTNGVRTFSVGGASLVELFADGTQTTRGAVVNDNLPVSMVFNPIQLFIVSAGHAYCLVLATNVLTEVTAQLQGTPIKGEFSDGYFIALLAPNILQYSNPLDGTTWDASFIDEVSVFPEAVTSIICNHRELWVFGGRHFQPYQDTGSNNIFDVIPGAMMETGNLSTFGPCRVDNTVFWVDESERGAFSAWRANGYSPERISTHAVELALSSYANTANLVSYAYQEAGHLFWVLYIPGAPCSWVYDVCEGLWHKRASFVSGAYGPHFSWNHVFAFGMHLVGDWNTGNIYQMSMANLTDNGAAIRRLRQAPTVDDEKKWILHTQLTIDFETGLGPQPPFTDGDGNPRQPQATLSWSDDRGRTWGNDHILNCGFAGQYSTRVVQRRLGRSRNRVYRLVMTDPIAWVVTDAYLDTVPSV
jgi:hypothetical protein